MSRAAGSRFEVKPLDASRLADFDALHGGAGCGWCWCVAWWVDTWDGWGERTCEENRAVREELLSKGVYDGYLCYREGRAVGWCQAGPRDRWTKLVRTLELAPDPATWGLPCFLVAPGERRQGVASFLLDAVLEDLAARGIRRVEAYPRRVDPAQEGSAAEGELWNGPAEMFRRRGFEVGQDSHPRPVMSLDLSN